MQNFFSSEIINLALSCLITRYPHSSVVFTQSETIMTSILQEREEVSDELLSILLTSINRKKVVSGFMYYLCFAVVCCLLISYIKSFCMKHFIQHVSSRSWKLGEKVLTNCTYRLRHFLPKFVRSGNLNVDDYSPIVAHICLKASED